MLWKSIICDCGGQNNLPCMDYFSVQSRLVRSGKRLSSQVAGISVPLATLHNLPVWLWFWGHGREGRTSTLLKGKNWREFPSLLRSCYFARNLLWPGSAAGAIALLGNAYINYQMNPTEPGSDSGGFASLSVLFDARKRMPRQEALQQRDG